MATCGSGHARNASQRPYSALREELNQSLKTTFEHNSRVLGIWLSFEPNGLDGKDSEFIGDRARVSNETGRFLLNALASQQMKLMGQFRV